MVDHIQRETKTGLISELSPTLDRRWSRMAVLSTAHKLKRQANPCELPSIRTLFSRARRAAVKRGERHTKRLPSPAPSSRLCWPPATTVWRVYATALCFGFSSGGRRRSEIAAADMRDLRKVGEEGYLYRTTQS